MKKFPAFTLWLDQHDAIWPAIGTTESRGLVALGAVSTVDRSKMAKPTPASVEKTAFFPGIGFIENGSMPPAAGETLTKSLESEPSDATSQTARKPGVGGIPFTDAMSLVPSSLKMRLLAAPGGPEGGVVWLSSSALRVLCKGVRPLCWSTLKQLEHESQSEGTVRGFDDGLT